MPHTYRDSVTVVRTRTISPRPLALCVALAASVAEKRQGADPKDRKRENLRDSLCVDVVKVSNLVEHKNIYDSESENLTFAVAANAAGATRWQ
jgi:hypothetical protein